MRTRPLMLLLLTAMLSWPLCLLAKPSPSEATRTSASTRKKAGAKKRKRQPHKRISRKRARRIKRAFVASADLKPMARQLLQDRTPAAYQGVEHWARRHNDDAGALAWLLVGYAHTLDKQYAAAIEPLKRARRHAGEVADYVDYYLATSYAQTGKFSEAAAALKNFDSTYPDSILRRAALVAYANALVSTGKPQEAIRLLQGQRVPARSDVELALGRAYSAAGQPARAAEALRLIYFTMPLSAEAGDAEILLKPLSGMAGVPPESYEQRKTRAALLAQGSRYRDAVVEYRTLLRRAPPQDTAALQVALASSLMHGGRSSDARTLLEKISASSGEMEAQRLYLLLELERPDVGRVEKTLSALRANETQSPWLEAGLLSAGNMYLLNRDYEQAAGLYAELQRRFPNGKYAAYAHWKASWLRFRLGKTEEARSGFERQVQLYPHSPQVAAALYWRARVAEDEHEYARARTWYQKLSQRFPYYYYGEQARERLRTLPAAADPPADAVLDRIPRLHAEVSLSRTTPPADDLRAQRTLLLENGALYDLALGELDAAAAAGEPWAMVEMARIYQEEQRYDRAVRALKRAVRGYFALEIEQLPRPVWEALFPRPWWDDLKRHAVANQLDPYLVAALVRQESEFNPDALSRANAIGLMQLLPGTGRKVARDLKIRRYSVGRLTDPSFNLQLGTRYFHDLLDKFKGQVEYALAAYNAGPDRVEEWRTSGEFRDMEEFVESIPFTETREYVQAILRTAGVYRRLYEKP